MQATHKRKRKPGNRMPPLDFTAPERWTIAERVQYAVQMMGGLQAAEQALGIPQRTLANWQSGESVPSDLQRLRQMSEAARRPPDWIERGGPLIEPPRHQEGGQNDCEPSMLTLRVPASVLLAAFRAACSELPLKTVEELHRATAEALARERNERPK